MSRPAGSWPHLKGRVTAEMIHSLFPAPGPEVMVAACGPPAWMDLVTGDKCDLDVVAEMSPEEKEKLKKTNGRQGGLLQGLGYEEVYVFE